MRSGAILCLALGVWMLAGAAAGAAPAGPKGDVLENLEYRVDILGVPEAVRAGVVLKNLGPARYQAVFTAEVKGRILAPLSGHRRDSYLTEMVLRDGRLLPVVYREESRRKGKHHLKEYRFNYEQGTLELWQPKKGQLACKWQKELKGAVYDPVSAFYNCRLGLLGPLAPGATLKITGIPYPEPEEFQVRFGPQSGAGGQAMVAITNEAFENKRGVVHVQFDRAWVPTLAWTRILGFGKIVGQLLPGSKALKGPLPGMAPPAPAGGLAALMPED